MRGQSVGSAVSKVLPCTPAAGAEGRGSEAGGGHRSESAGTTGSGMATPKVGTTSAESAGVGGAEFEKKECGSPACRCSWHRGARSALSGTPGCCMACCAHHLATMWMGEPQDGGWGAGWELQVLSWQAGRWSATEPPSLIAPALHRKP